MSDVTNYIDGDYKLRDVIDSLGNDFLSEKEFCDFIEANIKLFCLECIGVKLQRYKREYQINKSIPRQHKSSKRIDFVIWSECGKIIGVECKAPRNSEGISSAIGQSLTYIAMMEIADVRIDHFFIVSTKIDLVLPLVISRFNLPIGFIAVDKTKYLKMIDHGSTGRK